MAGVPLEGTSKIAFAGSEYISAGKTGTAQVVALKKNEKYDAKKMPERHRDHSLYTAFAPMDNPRIAIGIIVENGGFGSEAAAPIVRKALDYYLLGKKPINKDKTPVEKIDGDEVKSTAALKAEDESIGGPRPGGETQGNKE